MASVSPNLHEARRAMLRTGFKEQVAAGQMRPLVLPYCVTGTFILPILYLCSPHTKRPWLYRLRFAVMAAVVALNLRMMSHSSSTNMASAYAAGLSGAWGMVWNATLLVWMRPQFESMRVERRKRKKVDGVVVNGGAVVATEAYHHFDGEANGHAAASEISAKAERRTSDKTAAAPDESVAAVIEEYEYVWQPYPENQPFLTRLDWAFDLCTAFRGSGWSHSMSAIPHFSLPDKAHQHHSDRVRLDSIPLETRAGYVRLTTYRAFFRNRILLLALSYLALDFVGVMMMHDPYFIFGPANRSPSPPLPPRLASLHPYLLHALRNAESLIGVYGALTMIFSFDQLVRVFVLRPVSGARADLWQYPSIFGGFASVLDHGLAGFWGTWWHQSFRLAFVAPTAWLVRRGHLDRGIAWAKAVGSLIAFAQSGFLHAGGSFTTLPRSHWWMPPVFFLLSWVGVVVQGTVSAYFRPQIARLPRVVRRAGNLVFVALWLHLTAWPFLDDLGRSAVWLFEPVPISPCRALGLGRPGESWWRWDRDHFPVWYSGKTWWETGIGI